VIAGGGVAALEAALALRELAEERVSVTMLSPEAEFVFQPLSVGDPFALGPAKRYPLKRFAADLRAELREASLVSVDAGERTVATSDGELSYDSLLVAVGARRVPAYEHALTFRGQEDGEPAHGLIQDVEGGYTQRLAFVVPPEVAWSLPLYELALMTARRAYEMSMPDMEITLVTPEDSPLAVFGRKASAEVSRLLDEAGVRVEANAYAEVERKGEVVIRPSERRLQVQRIVALPHVVGREVVGLPSDGDGFIPIDDHARVVGVEAVFAAGDGTNFPIKQGGIACQQADVAARVIAYAAGARVEPEAFKPVLRGQLLTGSSPRFMRHEITGGHGEASEVSDHTLWWPPTKVAGLYLGPYLGAMEEASGLGEPAMNVQLELVRGEREGTRKWVLTPTAGGPPAV